MTEIWTYNKSKLYQGVHPSVYGYEHAWKDIDILVDVDNWEDFPNIFPENHIYLRWKIEDGDLPDKNKLVSIGRFIARSMREGNNVLIHCAAGQNRSVLLSAVVIYLLSGVEGPWLYTYLKSLKPMCLTNQTYRDFVQTIEQHMTDWSTNE